MQFRGDDRAQSIQVGAILVFGILIITLATFQATVVPDQNAGVEFDHSQTVQSDMQDLRNGIVRAADGDASPTRLSLGTTYPNRLMFINPPPPSGDLETVGADDPSMNVTIGNESGRVSVVKDHEKDHDNARAYWASADGAGVYNTAEVVYTPDYAEYDGAPTTVYGDSVLYNTFDNGANRTLSGQRLVQGNTINLLALRGDLDESSAGSYTADVTTISEQARTVTVQSEENDRLSINVTSRLSASVWNDSLLGTNAEASDARTWTDDGVTYHRIQIELAPGTYKLRGAAVGVGALENEERKNVTKPAYMVVTEDYQPVANESNETLTVEVRDQFNNPVTNATVNASADGEYLQLIDEDGNFVNETTFVTNSEGQAEIEYRGADATRRDASLNVSIGEERYEQVVLDNLTVPGFSAGGDDRPQLNPGTTGDLILTGASNPSGSNVDLEFNNTIGTPVNITTLRLNFYFYTGGGSGPSEATSITADGDPRASNVEVGGTYRSLNPEINVQPNDTGTTFSLTFDEDPSASGGNRDFFVVSLVFEVGEHTYQETYFASL